MTMFMFNFSTKHFQVEFSLSLKRGKHCTVYSPHCIVQFSPWEMRIFASLSTLSKPLIAPPSTSSSILACSVLIKPASRLSHPATRTHLQLSHHIRQLSSTPYSKMSFSNTDVPGDKPADPYKATNLTNPDLKEKVQDLVSFIEACKFGMMTTRIESSGLLTSRCMALAAKVVPPLRSPSSIGSWS